MLISVLIVLMMLMRTPVHNSSGMYVEESFEVIAQTFTTNSEFKLSDLQTKITVQVMPKLNWTTNESDPLIVSSIVDNLIPHSNTGGGFQDVEFS